MNSALAVAVAAFGMIPVQVATRHLASTPIRLGIVLVLAIGAGWLSWFLLEWPRFFLLQWLVTLSAFWLGTSIWTSKHARRN
ncbi:MAG: hypothetical protein AB7N24_18290 [Dehalococcoidia bacterium]